MHRTVLPVRALALALLAIALPGMAATAPSSGTPPREPTIRETMAQVGRIADELKTIDGRLQRMEKSIAGIDQSLGPVGVALKQEALRELAKSAGDVASERAQSLLLLATACAAFLIALHAALRRYLPPR